MQPVDRSCTISAVRASDHQMAVCRCKRAIQFATLWIAVLALDGGLTSLLGQTVAGSPVRSLGFDSGLLAFYLPATAEGVAPRGVVMPGQQGGGTLPSGAPEPGGGVAPIDPSGNAVSAPGDAQGAPAGSNFEGSPGLPNGKVVEPPRDFPAVNAPLPDQVPHIQHTDLQPDAIFDSITARELEFERKMLPPARLNLRAGVQNYALDGDSKMLFEQVAAKLGLQAVFDGDFPKGRFIHFRLNEADAREALHGLEAATGSFLTPISDRAFIVAADTEPKRRELEQMEIVSIPVPQVLTVQEITELGQALKQAIGIEKIFWDSQTNEIVLKDKVSRVSAAQAVLSELIDYRSVVAIDLEFAELNETQMLEIGVDLQTSFPIKFLGQVLLNSVSTSGVSLSQITKIAATHLFGVAISNVNLVAQMTNAGARNLLRATIVSADGQKATFHSGSKYPVITSQFIGATSGTLGSAPSFTFEDLGLVVTVTPHVHGVSGIGIDLETEYKLLGSGAVNGIPIIENRKIQSTVNLRDNQWALVAGLTEDTRSKSLSGPAFLSYIPWLGHLVSHFTGNKAKTYLLLAVKPRLLSMPPDQKATREFYLGSETRAVTPL